MRQLLLKQGGNGIGRFDLSAVDRCQQLPPSVGQREIHLAFVCCSQLPHYELLFFDRAENFRNVRRGQPQQVAQLSAGEPSGLRETAQGHAFVQADSVQPLQIRFELVYGPLQVAYSTQFVHTPAFCERPACRSA